MRVPNNFPYIMIKQRIKCQGGKYWSAANDIIRNWRFANAPSVIEGDNI